MRFVCVILIVLGFALPAPAMVFQVLLFDGRLAHALDNFCHSLTDVGAGDGFVLHHRRLHPHFARVSAGCSMYPADYWKTAVVKDMDSMNTNAVSSMRMGTS